VRTQKQALLQLTVVVIIALIAALAVAVPDRAARLHPHHGGPAPPSGSGGVAVGAWNPGLPEDLTDLYDYQNEVGRKPSVVLWYQSWGPAAEAAFCKSCAQKLKSGGYEQVVTWEPQDYRYGADQPDYDLDSIIDGTHDAYIKQYADDIKASGVPVYLRLMHEMNGDWYPYGDGVNGNTPDEYKKAWIHVHDLFEAEGATNVKWVWCPNVDAPNWRATHSMSSFYPGDAYVDWVALDGYNWSSVHDDPWLSFDQIFSGSYSEITSVAPTKPLMVVETASEELGGDKAQWIKDLEADIKSKYPKIEALIWFNQHADGANWPVDSSQAALSAYRQLVADPYFQGAMP
jgi:hypothetical protein